MNRFRIGIVCIVFFLAGYLANTLLTPKQAQAQVQVERVYKMVDIDRPSADQLNAAAKGGWRIVPMHFGDGRIIFEK